MLLRNNHNLKELAISSAYGLGLGSSFDHPHEFKFKLEKLTIDCSPAQDQEAFFPFLETQSQSLESLEIIASFTEPCVGLILSMSKLTSFTTDYERFIDAIWNLAQPLPVNTTITSLEFKNEIIYDRPDLFEALIRSLTSLKRFKCFEISPVQFDFLTREVPALESFEAHLFSFSRFPEGDVFPNLKEFKVGHWTGRTQEPTGNSNLAVMARAAMRES